ncbi:MAG: hypothetical protein NC913_04025 [Candidatus Omnitrophica bacterium]|nr:hypothetical protein [Candidatus Omnitrophota bacterium]
MRRLIGLVFRCLCVKFLFISNFSALLFSTEKTLSENLAPILQKQIFFSPLQTKKQDQSLSLPVFVSPLQTPQPIDTLYTLMGVFFYSDGQEKNTAVLLEQSSKKIIFLKINDTINGNRVLAINDNGVVFQSPLGDRFILTTSGIRYNQVLPQRFYFKINMKNAFEWLRKQPEFLFTIAFASGNGIGFSVQEIEPGSIFEVAGFMKNDRVIQINDIILKTPKDAFGAYSEILKTGKKLAIVKLVRNNRPVELVYILE